ncbi:MAG: pyrimidine 5'-nucleotidase [Anaerolineales bacterium]|nr:pyrimidine 5'-nucleotidase [Anaerolineales bacterium]
MSLTTIIFDLDDTLYPRGTGPLQEVGRRIHQWLIEQMGLEPDEAKVVRRRYAERYGTTLGGLVAEHHVDVDEYLLFVHDIPVERYVQPNPDLAAMLERLPLRKVVYTNATAEYSQRVMQALGIATHFDRIVGIEDVDFRNKPYRDAFERALHLFGGIRGTQAIMVEDMARNLVSAKALGLKTILVNGGPESHIDFVVDHVLQVEQVVDNLLRPDGSTSHTT